MICTNNPCLWSWACKSLASWWLAVICGGTLGHQRCSSVRLCHHVKSRASCFVLFVLFFWKSSGCFELSVFKWLALLVSWKLESWRDAYHAALSWEPDSGNQRIVIALVKYGRVKQLGNRRREGECISKIAAHSLSPVNPRFSDSAQQGLWIHYPHWSSSCRSIVSGWGASRSSSPKWTIAVATFELSQIS